MCIIPIQCIDISEPIRIVINSNFDDKEQKDRIANLIHKLKEDGLL